MMKQMLKHVASVLCLAFLMGFGSPVYNWIENPSFTHRTFSSWADPWHWTLCLAISVLLYLIYQYFMEYRPRAFYYCFDLISLVLVIQMEIWGSILAVIFLPWPQNPFALAVSICVYLFLLAFLIYASGHRGLAIYRDKIRIFKFRIKTYHTTLVDDISIVYGNFIAQIKITVCGETTTFRIPTFAARLCQRRLTAIPTERKEREP